MTMPDDPVSGGAGSRPEAPAARFFWARSRLALGEREAALALLSDLTNVTDMEKIAWLYLARRLQTKSN